MFFKRKSQKSGQTHLQPGHPAPATRGRRPGQAALYDRALARLEAATGPITLLDLACGSGVLSTRLAEALPNLKVIGADPSSDCVRLATRASGTSPAAKRLSFHRSDLLTLPLSDACVDLVIGVGVLAETSSPPSLLTEVHRVLSPGGAGLLLEELEAGAEDSESTAARLALTLERVQKIVSHSPFRGNSRFEQPPEAEPGALFEITLTKPVPETRYGRR